MKNLTDKQWEVIGVLILLVLLGFGYFLILSVGETILGNP